MRPLGLNSPYNILTVALPTVYFGYHGYTELVAAAVKQKINSMNII